MAQNSRKPSPPASPAAAQPSAQPAQVGTAHVVVKGAREHNLKGVDLAFPRDTLTTFTGVRSVSKELEAILHLMGANERHVLGKVVLPSAITLVFSSSRPSGVQPRASVNDAQQSR